MIRKLFRPIIFLIGFGLVIALSILWIVSIISFFYATPFTAYIFSSRFVSFFASANIFLIISIPLFSLLMFLIRKVFKKTVARNLHLRAGLWGLWVVNVISLLCFGITEFRNFNMGAVVTKQVDLPYFDSDTLFLNRVSTNNNNSLITFGWLKLADNGLINNDVHYRIKRSDTDDFEVIQKIHSRGRTLVEAKANAQAVNYFVTSEENAIDFPSSFPIFNGTKYRGQEVDVIVKVPVGKTIKMDHGISRKVQGFDRNDNIDQPWYYDGEHFWTMEEDGFVAKEYIAKMNQQQSYNSYKDFSQVQIDGRVKVKIEYAPTFDIKIKSKDRYLKRLEVDQIGDILTIALNSDHVDSPPKVTIKMPTLLSYDGNETADVNISGFTQKNMLLKSDGRHDLRALVNVDSIVVKPEGRASFDIRGKGNHLKAVLEDRSELEAERYTVNTAEIKLDYDNRAALSVLDTLYRKGERTVKSQYLKVDGEPTFVDLIESEVANGN